MVDCMMTVREMRFHLPEYSVAMSPSLWFEVFEASLNQRRFNRFKDDPGHRNSHRDFPTLSLDADAEDAGAEHTENDIYICVVHRYHRISSLKGHRVGILHLMNLTGISSTRLSSDKFRHSGKGAAPVDVPFPR